MYAVQGLIYGSPTSQEAREAGFGANYRSWGGVTMMAIWGEDKEEIAKFVMQYRRWKISGYCEGEEAAFCCFASDFHICKTLVSCGFSKLEAEVIWEVEFEKLGIQERIDLLHRYLSD